MRVPLATYRLQFGPSFGFDDAVRIVPYLDRMGVTDVYASPLLAARPGSEHGYDVVDPTRISPELGGEEGLDRLVEELRRRGMGLLLDVVPNHMATDGANPWWMDVLERGRSSRYAGFFDIDWDGLGPEGKILVPVLGVPVREVLAAGELSLDVEGGSPRIRYHEHRFPVAPGSIDRVLGRPPDGGDLRRLASDPAALERVLGEQPYELASWRWALQEGSYRRFFDITDLISLRTEDHRVLEATHGTVLRLVRQGKVTGLRIDHIDGLADPAGYLGWLRARAPDAYIVVEKILGEGESLPEDWPVAGTSGYDFLNDLTRLLVDGEGLAELTSLAERVAGPEQARPFREVAKARKRRLAEELFGGDVARLARLVQRMAGGRAPRPEQLARAVIEVSAALPVYRTYIRSPEISPRDRRYVEQAVADARRDVPRDVVPAIEVLREILLLEGPPGSRREDRVEAAVRWQQLTGPLAAKGLEDTALYVWNRLLSLNEVGGDPGAGALGPAEFHRKMAARAAGWPHALNTTSTHDTKRSEDVRSRISVLSEVPTEWSARLERWRNLNRPLLREAGRRTVPDGSEELLLYQTLVGVWPPGAAHGDAGLVRRVQDYLTKAAREAKVHTSWVDVDEEHEEALRGFAADVLAPSNRPFLEDLRSFVDVTAVHGALNALAQVVVKACAPGVPDVYQGTEEWSLRLVDPDNRGPVDLDRLARRLDDLDLAGAEDRPGLVGELLGEWPDGRLKQLVTAEALRFRRRAPDLFLWGEYLPLEASGEWDGHVVAFARRRGQTWAVAAVPRLTTPVAGEGRFPLGGLWGETSLHLPSGAPDRWRDVLSRRGVERRDGGLLLAEVFEALPVALLAGGDATVEAGRGGRGEGG